jgi:hypothetical protein
MRKKCMALVVFVKNFEGTSSRIVTRIRAMELSVKDFITV